MHCIKDKVENVVIPGGGKVGPELDDIVGQIGLVAQEGVTKGGR